MCSAREHLAITVHRAFIARAGEEVVFERGRGVSIGLRGDLRVDGEGEAWVGVAEAVLRGPYVDA